HRRVRDPSAGRPGTLNQDAVEVVAVNRVGGGYGAADVHTLDVVDEDAVAGVRRRRGANSVALDVDARVGQGREAVDVDALLGVASDGVPCRAGDAADERVKGVLQADAIQVVRERIGWVADGRALNTRAGAVDNEDPVQARGLDIDVGAGDEAADGVVVGAALDPDAVAAGAKGGADVRLLDEVARRELADDVDAGALDVLDRDA